MARDLRDVDLLDTDPPLLDTDLIVERRQQLRLSDRQLAKQLGTTAQTIRRLETGSNHRDLTLRFVERLARCLGVPVDTLLGRPHGADPNSDNADVARAGALLTEADTLVHVDTVAHAAGWDLPHTRTVLDRLEQVAPLVGQRLHRLRGQVALVRAEHDTEQIAALHRRADARTGMKANEASLLHRIVQGDTDPRALAGNATQVALGRLRNAGYVSRDTDPVPSSDLHAAFAAVDQEVLVRPRDAGC